MKRTLNVKTCTPNCFVYGEIGRFSLRLMRQLRVIRYRLNIVSNHKSRYVTSVHNQLLTDCETHHNKYSWASLIRDLLNSTGFGDVWLAQGVTNSTIY